MAMIKLPDQFGVETWIDPDQVRMLRVIPEGDRWALRLTFAGMSPDHDGVIRAPESEIRELADRITGEAKLRAWLEQRGLGDIMRDPGEHQGNQVLTRSCRICGCTDEDCSGCIERTGEPCVWVEADLCSACEAHRADLRLALEKVLRAGVDKLTDHQISTALKVLEDEQLRRRAPGETPDSLTAAGRCNVCGEVLTRGCCNPAKAVEPVNPDQHGLPLDTGAAIRNHLEAQAQIDRGAGLVRESSAACIAAERENTDETR